MAGRDYKTFHLTSRGESYTLKVFKRLENSAFEYESIPSLTFKGRPANNMEKKRYRLQAGVEGNEDSIYIFSTNLPNDVNIGDNVLFLGKQWKVASVGYYFDNSLIVNADLFDENYLIARCPKGITLQ